MNIVTPVNVTQLEYLLHDTGYDREKSLFLINGFKNGFDLGYRGETKVQMRAPNLPFIIGNETMLWNKVMNEVKLGRFASPYDHIPFKYFIQSPIGLVPKDGGTKTRLIFHLSYPRNIITGRKISVNANIPREYCTVHYPDFNDAVVLCAEHGKNCVAGKSDMNSAFRNFSHRQVLVLPCNEGT